MAIYVVLHAFLELLRLLLYPNYLQLDFVDGFVPYLQTHDTAVTHTDVVVKLGWQLLLLLLDLLSQRFGFLELGLQQLL